ncbi:reverse transcriptase domain-containing protein [Tanacetum coccineum]
MGIAEDVVVRVDGFTFLADFVVVNFEPDPRVPIILGRPFLRTTKALIDLYEETLTLRVGKEKLVYYATKLRKNKHFVHAISVIDFSKDDPFSGSTTTHSDDPSPSSSPVKTSDNLEEFADELTLLKKDVQEGNFQDHSNPLFEFDDNFKSSTVNPLFNKMDEDVVNENSNVSDSDEPVLLNTPLSDKVECFAPEDDIDEIDAFLAIEVSSNFEEGYFDSEGDVTFLDNLLSDDTTHNLASEVISDHEPEQNESSITFSPRSDPLHHEFAGELLTLPSRNDREFGEYLSLMTVLCEISTSRSQENVHANQSSIIESLPVSPIPVEDSEPVQEEIDIFLVPDDLIPPGVENDDSEDEDNELPNLDHQDDPSIPRPPPEPPDVEKCLEPEAGTDKSKITRKQSKTGKHGHENQKSTKPKPEKSSLSQSQAAVKSSQHGQQHADLRSMAVIRSSEIPVSHHHNLGHRDRKWYYLLSENGEKVEVQISNLTTDYVDCLQRTNVTSMIGRKMLESQLRRLGVFDAERNISTHPMATTLYFSSSSILVNSIVFLLERVAVDEDPAEANKDGIDGNVEPKLLDENQTTIYKTCYNLNLSNIVLEGIIWSLQAEHLQSGARKDEIRSTRGVKSTCYCYLTRFHFQDGKFDVC